MLSYQRMGWRQRGQWERGLTMLSWNGQAGDADVQEAAEEQAEEKGGKLEG